METFSYAIRDVVGLHARPAGRLVKEAGKFVSKITLAANDKVVDAKRLMQLMSAGITQGTKVTVSVEGTDEKEAAEALRLFFEKNL